MSLLNESDEKREVVVETEVEVEMMRELVGEEGGEFDEDVFGGGGEYDMDDIDTWLTQTFSEKFLKK
jgi:hypothetical protein